MKKGSVTTTKLNTYKKNYKRFMQQQQQQKQKNNPNYNTNYTPRYKLVRRSNSQDNFISKKDAKITEKYITEDMLDDVRTRLTSLIEFKTKYYVDQRMLTLMQSDDILTRGADAIRITSDWSTGGKAFIFSNNGEPVAKITDNGVLYCKNIWMNGVNMMQLVNNILNSLSDGASIYVKHIDLKNGTYEMDIKEAIMKHLLIKPDNTDNNTLECFNGDGYGMLMNTDKGAGYVMFNPNMSNGNTIYGLRFGKNDSTGVNIRYTYSTTAANSYLAMGPINRADTLNVYYDRRVIINTANNLSQCLLCKYSGNLGNNQYLRIGCGDNRDTGIFAYGRANNANYLYLKLQGRSASIAVYANYTSFDSQNYMVVNNTKTSGGILYMRMPSISNNGQASLYIGKSEAVNDEAAFGYIYSTSNPLGYLGFYGNETLITYDTAGNTNITGSLTANSITSNGNISGTDIYASNSLTVDGTALITQLDVANTTKNTWYAKLRVEDYLSNNEYIRMIFKDLSKQGYIDFTKDTQYYKLKLYVSGSPGMLTINETGLEFDGQVDCHNDLVLWQKLLASDIYAGASTNINMWDNVVCKSNLQVSGMVTSDNIYTINAPGTWDSTKTIRENLGIHINNVTTICGINNFPSQYHSGLLIGVNDSRSFMITLNKEYPDGDDFRLYHCSNGGGGATQGYQYTDTNIYSKILTNRNYNENITSLTNLTNINTTNITAKKYELQSASTDYSSGFGANFTKVLMDTLYPVGSIYMSMVPLQNTNYYPETSPNNKFEVYWNGCTWRLLDNGIFLRNGQFNVLDVSGSVDPDDPYKYRYYVTGAGDTGGEATHTHTTGDHTLTINEMPSHNHKVYWHGYLNCDGGSAKQCASANWIGGDPEKTWGCDNKGGNKPHNHGNTGSSSNLPPYVTCYMYQRIA